MPVFQSVHEVEHWFTPREGIITCYVVEVCACACVFADVCFYVCVCSCYDICSDGSGYDSLLL